MSDTDVPAQDGGRASAGDGSARRRRLEAVVRGSVQGVGFRYFVVREASALRLAGWVANEADGSVRCVAEGPEQDLLRLLRGLREGPRAARVAAVEEHWAPATGEFTDFGIASRYHSGD